MPLLSLSPANGSFVWTGTHAEADAAKHDLAGWTRTTVAPPGQVRYYTADLGGQPVHNPYAAVPFGRWAEGPALERLDPLLRDYEASFALEASLDGVLPAGEDLRPFQRSGVLYASQRDHTLIGDEMGLGKTVQALALANLVGARRILVICPAAVLLQWRAACRRFLLPPTTTFLINDAKHGVHPGVRVVLVSYDRCRGPIGDALAAEPWDLMVLDEAHYLRNYTAARTEAIVGSRDQKRRNARPGVIRNAARIVALTGTPLPNRPRECYTLARALNFEALDFMSEEAFQDRFNPSATFMMPTPENPNRRVILEKTGRLPELNARLRCNFMVRRLKADAAPGMPEKSYALVPVGNRETEKVVKAERLLDINPDSLDAVPMDMQGHIAALRREMGLAKIPLIVDYVRTLTEGDDEPVVLFAFHREVIAQLTEKLAGLHPVVVTGSTSPRQRLQACQTFAEDPRCRLFIGQLQSAGTGVDGLQKRSCRAIFAEPSWVPGENEQCVDRLHRMGQGRPVQADFLVAPDSLDERIIARAIEKLRVAHVALDNRLAAV